MGSRLSGPQAGDGSGGNGQHLVQSRQQREALRVLSCYEQPITWQVEGWSGRGHQSRPTSECSTRTEQSLDNCQGIGVTAGSAYRLNAYVDRPCCNHHVSQPPSHYTACKYLPSFPHDMEHLNTLGLQVKPQGPELPSQPKEQGCLFGCCGTNTDEPGSFLGETEDQDLVPVGYLPLLHELDSGLGCTDGSFHQGELSGPETEEGGELGSSRDRISPGSSSSSQSLISSELSDSGFYSVSAGDFHHFQRLLERKMRLYRAGASGEMQERGAARLDLQSIPEASPPPRDTGPPHFRRAGSARLCRCPSGPLLPPQPGPSSCSTPSCLRRKALQQRNASLELLNSSQWNLDCRRASHPSACHSRASEHPCWRPAPDWSHVAQRQHRTLPRELCCKEYRLGHEALNRKEIPRWQWEMRGGREHHCLMHGLRQDDREAWSKPAGEPYNNLGPVGRSCGELGPTGSPSSKAPMGSPCNEGPTGSPCGKGPMGSSCTEGPMGSPYSEGPTGSPCSKGPMGSSCTEGPMGSSHSALDPMGSSCTECPMGSPSSALGPMGSPYSEGPKGSPCTEGPMGGPYSEGPMGSPCTEGPMGGPYSEGPMGGPSSALDPMGSPCTEGTMGSSNSVLGPMGSPYSEGTMGSSNSVLGPMGSPYSEGTMGSSNSVLGPMGSPYSEGPGKPRMGRSQLLKARALRLADERSENTTDEEACEVQIGRYCSRAERRRHLLLAQERRQRKKNGGKGGSCQGGGGGGGACPGGEDCQGGGASCSTVLELSHRKLSRLRNNKLLDDWTTVAELLTHGTRAGSQEILSFSPLLSVTTV